MKLDVIIADDEPLAREIVKTYLGEIAYVNIVDEVCNGQEAMNSINENKPDLIFLDIKMPKIDGISLLENEKLRHIPFVIFTTAYDEYAIKAFELNAIDYLLKPFDQARFNDTIDKAFNKMKFLKWKGFENQLVQLKSDYSHFKNEPEADYPVKIVLRDAKKIKHILVESIDYISGSGDYVEIHHGNGKSLYYKTLSAFCQRLNPSKFRRIHKSVIINCDKIEEIRTHTNGEYFFHIQGGAVLKSGRTYKESILDLVQTNF